MLGVLIARMQPLHTGHASIINRMIEDGCKPTVLIGSAGVRRDGRNPLNYRQRRDILLDQYPSITVLPLPDLPTDSEWVRAIGTILGDVPIRVYYARQDEDLKDGKHYIDLLPYPKVQVRIDIPIHARHIRADIELHRPHITPLTYEIMKGLQMTKQEFEDDLREISDRRIQAPTTPPHKVMNHGASNYAEHSIQPWDIWKEYKLDPWRADIVKRVLRIKEGQEVLDLQKIKHLCDELLWQIAERDK